MTRKRITGVVGGGDMKVFTEWFEDPEDGTMRGIEIGAKLRGWRDVEIETDEDH